MGVATVAVAALVIVAPARAADAIYWGTGSLNTISFARLDGSGGGDLGTTGATTSTISGAAIDAVGGRIYWANLIGAGANTISYANLDGSGGGDLPIPSDLVHNPSGMALDSAAGRLYWTNVGDNSVVFAALDGSESGRLSTAGATVFWPRSITVDPAAGRLYGTNAMGNNTIWYVRLDGSGGGDLSITGVPVSGPYGVAVDPATGRLYWANPGGSNIGSANRDGSDARYLETGAAPLNQPQGVAIDTARRVIFWGNGSGPDAIGYARLDGSGGGSLPTAGATVGDGTWNYVGLSALLSAPSATAPPLLTGANRIGAPLSCSGGTWAADDVSAFFYRAVRGVAYQWTIDGVDVPGATATTYTPTAGGTYACRVTASNHAGSTASTSAAVFVPTPPSGLGAPSIIGTLVVGQRLTASTGSWAGSRPLSYSYQWQRCRPACVDVGSPSADSSYVLVPADAGAQMRVTLTAANATGQASLVSASTGQVAASPEQIKASLLRQLRLRKKDAKIAAVLRRKGYTYTCSALSRGVMTVSWWVVPKGARIPRTAVRPTLVARGRRTFSTYGTAKVVVKLTTAGRRLLAHSRRRSLTVRGSFAPSGQRATNVDVKVNLTR